MLKAKYQKHTAAQYQQILQGARALFVEQGIERVNFSAVVSRWRMRSSAKVRTSLCISLHPVT